MPADAWITLVVIGVAFSVLMAERLPIPAVLAVALFALTITGVIDEGEALSGFASSAPFTIAALYVLAGAAAATGALSSAIDRLLDVRSSASSQVARLAAVTASVSAVMPNTPLVALFAPRLAAWSRRTGSSASHLLMPLSFASVLGGVITVMGTSTNLVVSDLLRAQTGRALGVFEVTPVGLPVAAVGTVLLALWAPRLLPQRPPAEVALQEASRRYTVAMKVDSDGPLVGVPVAEANLRHLNGVFLAALERADRLLAVEPGTVLEAGDTLYFVGDVTRVIDLHETKGLTSAEHPHILAATDRGGLALYEAVVAEGSTLAGSTLRDVGFRARNSAVVLAVHRADGVVTGKLGSVRLRPGDVLLVLAGADFAQRSRQRGDFALIASLDEQPPPRRQRAWIAIVAMLSVVVLAVTEVVSLLEASVGAAVAVVALRVVDPLEARRAVNLDVVLTIALSISLGTAVESSGLAAQLAATLGRLGEPFGVVGVVAALLVATMVLTELVSNNAAAAVMLPVAASLAVERALDLRTLAIVVLIGASCSFLTPIGYQTNLMVYGLGGYRFTDFTRLGAPLTLVVAAVTVALVPLVLPLH